MNDLLFKNVNEWGQHPELKQHINWKVVPENNDHIIYDAVVGEASWQIRLNDFPDEPLYTVIINKEEVFHFDDWPKFWSKPD